MSRLLEAAELEARARSLQLLVFDVDGVLTDGGLYYGPAGESFKRFHVRDGHGLVMARIVGLKAALLTARRSEIVEVRAKELQLVKVMQGQKLKGPAFEELAASLGLKPEQCGYMGDDTNDLAPMNRAGLAVCPADAVAEVRANAHWVSRCNGGHGAAREWVELVLKAQGTWAQALAAMGT